MNDTFYSSLSPLDIEVYNKYKSNDELFADILNRELRCGNCVTHKGDILTLERIFSLHSAKAQVCLYRATQLDSIIPFIDNDGIYTNPDFLST
jgi:hypothetical protein